LLDLVAGVCVCQNVERFPQFVVDDPSGIDVQPGEERCVQDGAHDLIAALVGCLGCFQQRQGVTEDCPPAVEMAFGVGQGVFDVPPFGPDRVDPGPQLVLRPSLLGRQVEVVILFAIEGVEPLGMLLPDGIAESVVAADGRVQASADLRPAIRRAGSRRRRSSAPRSWPGADVAPR
jgi:hypothetical protein